MGYVYITKNNNSFKTPVFKIGQTTQYVNRRLNTLNSSVPEDYKLLVAYRFDNSELADREYDLMQEFKDHRIDFGRELFSGLTDDEILVKADNFMTKHSLINRITNSWDR